MNHEQLLKDLVGIKSYSGEEGEVRGYTRGWLEERQVEVAAQAGNLVVHLEGRDKTRAFLFNSHMDTVSAGDLPWKYGPWTPTREDDKMVGLGASDMKSGLTASLLLAEKISHSGVPSVDMWFIYVVNEEVDGAGTKSFMDWFNDQGYLRRYMDMAAIFTEPTGLSELEHGHRGNIFLRVKTMGESGHASKPDAIKKHAVREMIAFADALKVQMEGWQKEFPSDIFTPPSDGEMTSIHAGVVPGTLRAASPNKFPSVCTATFDIRTTPEFHAVAWARLQELGVKLGATIEQEADPAPAGYTDPSERIVQISSKAMGGAELTVSQGSADLGFLTAQGIKAVIFGPGEKNQAHKIDEYCYPAKIPTAVNIYQAVVNAWADK